LNVMRTEPYWTPQALNALVISRSLERVADHATNIAEDVIFWVKGADVRHHMLLRDGRVNNGGSEAATH
jgi:phosphate transport system protein